MLSPPFHAASLSRTFLDLISFIRNAGIRIAAGSLGLTKTYKIETDGMVGPAFFLVLGAALVLS